jgi:hypothetical protein
MTIIDTAIKTLTGTSFGSLLTVTITLLETKTKNIYG